MGVLGGSGTEDEWAIDPEALLIFSIEIARHEPRLFDEILAWLLVNGDRLDISRIRRILHDRGKNMDFLRIVGGVFQYVSSHGDKRKWGNFVESCRRELKKTPLKNEQESLFMTKTLDDYPLAQENNVDPDFIVFGLNRPKIKIQKESKKVPVNSRTNIRFLLRALFGVGGKSEAILYLLTHEGARPKEIADDVGLFWLSIHHALLDLSKSGLVLTRTKGKKVEYWVSQKKWWEFISNVPMYDFSPPIWLNWSAIYSALSNLWTQLSVLAAFENLDYLRSSKLQDSLEVLAQEFSRGGFDIPRIPNMGIPPDLYQKTVLQFLSELFGMSPQTTSVIPAPAGIQTSFPVSSPLRGED